MQLNADRINFAKLDRVYVDAVFVIASHVPGSKDKFRADRMWARLIATKVKVCVSTLLLDELWYKAIYLFHKRDFAGQDFPKSDPSLPAKYYAEIEKLTLALLNLPNVELLPTPPQVQLFVDNTMKLMKTESLYPRDAFHIAMAQAYGIQYVISNDAHLKNLSLATPLIIGF
jgi:predicted nucleic acid-binding protein